MRIGIDARELCGRPTGVGRYLAGLLDAWAADDTTRRHEFLLYSHEAPAIAFDTRRFRTRTVSGSPGVLWEQLRLPLAIRSDRLDVLFAPAYTAPLASDVPLVVAIHDMSFVAHPEWFRTREGVRRRWLTRRAAESARAIVTISEFSRRELIDHFDVRPDRIHVIPPGVPQQLRRAASDNVGPLILFVGSIFNRRHVPDLIRAFGRIARKRADCRLALVGDNRSYPREDLTRTIATEDLEDRVEWRAYVSDAELRTMYSRARAFAFLSEYEGLGLTPLEALAAGVPPVLLDTAVARESCGEAAIYVPANDLAATAAALERALFDEAERARIRAAAPAVLTRYSWPHAGRRTIAVIEDACR